MGNEHPCERAANPHGDRDSGPLPESLELTGAQPNVLSTRGGEDVCVECGASWGGIGETCDECLERWAKP